MRIAFDHQIFGRQIYGGVSRYFVCLAQALQNAGQTVGIFAPLHSNHYLDELPSSVVHGRLVRRIPQRATPLLEVFNRRAAERSLSRWAPDVVHETYYGASVRSGRTVSATVVTVHDMIHELFPETFSAADRTSHLKHEAVKRADHVICISQTTRQDLMRIFNVDERKLSVVHLGSSRFPSTGRSSAGRTTSVSRPFVLYVGNRGGYKNFGSLLTAVATSNQLRNDLDIVAFGGGSFSREESERIRQLGFGDRRVRQLSGSDAVMSELYSNAAIFAHTSLYEGFGLSPLEAMSHGCPVVSSNAGSMPEVIGDAAEYFDPNSAESIASAIERVVYSPDHARTLVSRGLERVKCFSWQRCADATLTAYQRATGECSGRAPGTEIEVESAGKVAN